jgi:hypothetical protein
VRPGRIQRRRLSLDIDGAGPMQVELSVTPIELNVKRLRDRRIEQLSRPVDRRFTGVAVWFYEITRTRLARSGCRA